MKSMLRAARRHASAASTLPIESKQYSKEKSLPCLWYTMRAPSCTHCSTRSGLGYHLVLKKARHRVSVQWARRSLPVHPNHGRDIHRSHRVIQSDHDDDDNERCCTHTVHVTMASASRLPTTTQAQ